MTDSFLRIPPFPGHRAGPMALAGQTVIGRSQACDLVRLLKVNRIGGNFWGNWATLPEGRDLLLVPSSGRQMLAMLDAAEDQGLLGRCVMIPASSAQGAQIPLLRGTFDWWQLAEAAGEVWVGANHELALVAALAGRPLRTFGEGRFAEVSDDRELVRAVGRTIASWTYVSPFTGEAIDPAQAIELLTDWRRLIDRNRTISAVLGVAGWKRPTVDPMLWDGTSRQRHATHVSGKSPGRSFAVAWKSRTPAAVLDRLAEANSPVAEIEDGLIRGRGLGANCVPPLSVVVDFSGIYFDPAQPSDLEHILKSAEMDSELLDRAARLREAIVKQGISKYGGGSGLKLESGSGRRVLVLGQVEDDRSVLNGGHGQTNLALLTRARALNRDDWIIYRPHPDVEAGHRKGHIPDQEALRFADAIERGGSISALIDSVDEVHCITSLGGFEALLRGKKVTTHGVPFYAGWGLTTDLGPVPSRRNRRRSLDELVAAALILYPSYLDPVTRLPCPPEILVGRIARGEDRIEAPLAWFRKSQGKLRLALRRLREAAA